MLTCHDAHFWLPYETGQVFGVGRELFQLMRDGSFFFGGLVAGSRKLNFQQCALLLEFIKVMSKLSMTLRPA